MSPHRMSSISMRSSFVAWLILGLTGAVAQDANSISEEARLLERDFIEAQDFTLYQALASLPPSEYLLLVGERRHIADLGEDWDVGDIITNDSSMYRSQHL